MTCCRQSSASMETLPCFRQRGSVLQSGVLWHAQKHALMRGVIWHRYKHASRIYGEDRGGEVRRGSWSPSLPLPPSQPFPATAWAEGRLIKGGPPPARGEGGILDRCSRGYLYGTTIEYGRLLMENLEAVACTLHHKDPVLIINVYRYGPLERLLTRLQTLGSRPTSHHHRIELHTFPAPLGQRGLARQLGDKTAIGIEHLQAVVLEVGHVNGAILIHGDPGGPIELAITLSRSAKLHQKPAIWGEFLNAIVAPVGHVHIPMLVKIDAPGDVEFAVTAAAAAPLEQELPLLGEDLNPVIPAVHHVEVVIRTKG